MYYEKDLCLENQIALPSRGERINHSWLVREFFFNGGRAETEYSKHLWHSDVEFLLLSPGLETCRM